MTDLADLIIPVAIRLWGEPSSRSPNEWRFRLGRTISPRKGVWSDFLSGGEKVGGGVLDLIKRELKVDTRGAFEWLKAQGLYDEEPANENRQDSRPARNGKITATYEYTDETGRMLYEVCRVEEEGVDEHGKPKKRFMQRQPVNNGWQWNLQGISPTIFRLPDVQEAIATDRTIFVVEGEKLVEMLAEEGVPATCNSGGAGKWRPEFGDLLTGADVVILPDNDEVGQKHAKAVADSLQGKAKRVRILALPGLPPKGDYEEWKKAGGTIVQLYDLAAAAPEPGKEPYVSPFHAVPFWEIDNAGPEHEWLVNGMVTLGDVGILAGESGTGKTFIGVDLGMAVARGMSWMGRRVEPGMVIYNAGEGGMGLKKRLRAYRQVHGLRTDERIPFITLPDPIDLYTSDDMTEKLLAECKHWQEMLPDEKLRLIVIDTFSTATPGADENSAKDMTVVLKRGARLARETAATVIFVQHMNAGGEKVRGWTGIKANVDSVLICLNQDYRDDQGREVFALVQDKCKDGRRGTKWKYVLEEIDLGDDRHGEAVTSCVIGEPQSGGEKSASGPDFSSFTTNMRDTLAAIQKAVFEYGEKTPGGLNLPMSIQKVTKIQQVIDVYCRDILVVDNKASDAEQRKARDTARKAIQRGGADLKDAHYIGREGIYVWLTGKEPVAAGKSKAKPGPKRERGGFF